MSSATTKMCNFLKLLLMEESWLEIHFSGWLIDILPHCDIWLAIADLFTHIHFRLLWILYQWHLKDTYVHFLYLEWETMPVALQSYVQIFRLSLVSSRSSTEWNTRAWCLVSGVSSYHASHRHHPFPLCFPAGDVQPRQTQPPECGGDQHHLVGVVAASQPGLRHPD